MKSRLSVLILSAFLTALLGLRFSNGKISELSPRKQNVSLRRIGCAPDWNSLKTLLEESDIPLIAGSGNHKWTISTGSDSAQLYFDQGMNMYYCFHVLEAMASFKKAARFDSTCAMLFWAQALAYGPNINDGYTASEEALASEAKAIRFAATASEKEQLLIAAMNVRYSKDSAIGRKILDSQYTARMKEVFSKYADNSDVSALYVDAMMLEHPWNLWTSEGKAQPWTPEIRETLETILLLDSTHPGANHYYIHVMEPSPYADKALPSANRLATLTPALSHTVHMPSHIYLRTGQYATGITLNKNAINSYNKMISVYPAAASNIFLYLIHNVHMETNLAMMSGDLVQSVEAANATAGTVTPELLGMKGPFGNYFQYVRMTPILVNVRFERWMELIDAQSPADSLAYAVIIDRFGKGMAYSALGDADSARLNLEQIRLLMRDSSLYTPFTPFSPSIDGAVIAEQLLAGTIAQREKKYGEAIAAFTKAVDTDRKMVYHEPRDWMLNPRPYLGNALLLAGQPDEAERVFMDDFAVNNNNFWSAEGLKKIRR
jgi:tetratricopeptide (TPR) repeat protein